MDKPKKNRKPFAETGFGKFVTEKLPTVLGDVTGIAGKVMTGQWAEAMHDVSTALKGEQVDPQLQIEFETNRQNWTLELQRIDLEFFQAEIADKANARSLEMERVRSGQKNWTQNILAFTGVVAFFTMVGFLLTRGLGNMTTEESFIVGNVTGIVGGIAVNIYSYYFGSSTGSREKDRNMSELIKKKDGQG